ncbi:F0F1 ATP synthase subunit B [cyanobacterium endosymbiont of Epithemia clementina EcSB]|uniref:F0F1 ATP synthase subunit B n=1 Tax=cyanobacterium endosymbiont of Epithemia clementina EcSB TaxID=3034674 RepID=UPI00247FA47C|nr:F0F1 ATP synthase subunit B [cyanobacterium endosymbiont of Epithemia clementina EcSB]WGT67912.1 F0F1 ATP synthase subunit B [cyanobacterium endosymbiont of Epithemia clementina EcSB]
MLDSFFILATEAHEASKGGFGLDFNLLETNFLNLAILIGLLVFYGSKVLGKILNERRLQIANAIQEAEERQRKAATALGEEQQKLTQAQAEAERICQRAKDRAATLVNEIAEKSRQDVERLKETAAADLSNEQERVIAQLKKQIAQMAINQAERQLKEQVNEDMQYLLIDRSIAQLGG